MKTISIPVSILKKYRECDREKEQRTISFFHGSSLSKLEENIKKEGIKEPLELAIIDGKALLYEGNHRLAVAIRLGLKEVTVNVKINDEIERDLMIYLSDKKFKKIKSRLINIINN